MMISASNALLTFGAALDAQLMGPGIIPRVGYRAGLMYRDE